MEKAILTCALTGVLTDPKQHPVPVTPAQMAAEAKAAFEAGASIMHVHIRRQEEGMGHMPSWDPDVVWEPDHRRGGQRHCRAAGLHTPRAARNRGVQCRNAELLKDTFGWPLGLAADGV